jgi:uncharacterized protein DUF11/beta-propeller repeat-containing protein
MYRRKRVNVDRRWGLGTSGVRVRVLAAGLVLLAAGGILLGWGSRSRQAAATAGTHPNAIENEAATASPLAATRFRSGLSDRDAGIKAASLLARLPLMFEPNRGQANLDPGDSRARFIAHGPGYTLFLGSEAAIVSLRSSSFHGDKTSKRGKLASFQMKLAGANPNATLTATDLLPAKSNYLLGNDPSKWRHEIPQFAQVRYKDVYPGIDLVFYGNQGALEYDLQIAPGADPAQAQIEFGGAKALELIDGALIVKGEGGDSRLEAPRIYQEIAGRRQPIEGRFVLRGANRAGFSLGTYDSTRELIIDPNLSFSTYFGGSGDEHASSLAIDGSGNIYLTGSTTSPTLPVGASTAVLQSALVGVQNVYIAKINPTFNPPLQYVTYLGGSGVDSPVGIAVDGAGDPIVVGTTTSPNFPISAGTAYQVSPETGSAGPHHVFVTKLNPAASAVIYGTYLSGSGDDIASGMTTDGSENVYVTGTTTSTKQQDVGTPTGPQFPSSSLPYATPFQSTPLASIQFFVTKVNTGNAGKSSIIYSTYFGGANTANGAPIVATGGGIAVDTNGNIYFDGTTNFTYTNGAVGDFPILNAYQACLDPAVPTQVITNPPPPCTNSSATTDTDAFLAKITPPPPNAAQGPQLQWSTYFGGAQTDSATGIAVDAGAANVYIVGTTNSQPLAAQVSFAGYQICLNTPVNPAGGTASCPTSTATTPSDAFVARFTNPVASTTTTTPNVTLNYFSYLGGTSNEAGQAITVDSASGALVTGLTTSTDFPVFPNPSNVQGHLNGAQDAFVARLYTATTTGQNTSGSWATYFGGSVTSAGGGSATQGTAIALDVNQNTYFAGDTNSTDLQVTGLPQAQNNGGFDAFVTELQTTANLSIVGVLTLGTNQTYINAGNNATFTYTLTNNGPDLASNITVNIDLNQQVTIVPLTFVSASATSGNCSGSSSTTVVTCTISSLQPLSTATITVVVTPKAYPNGSQATFNGGAVQVLGANNSVLAEAQVSANMSDFALAVSPPNFSVAAAGDSAHYLVQLTPNPTYTTSIALSCTGLPTGAACSFAPSTVNLQGSSPGAVTLTVSTTARPIVTGSVIPASKRFYAVWLGVPGLALLGAGFGRDRRGRRILGLLLFCALWALLVIQPACSGKTTAPPTAGTPAGTSTITVTAASGSDSKSQSIQLTVP